MDAIGGASAGALVSFFTAHALAEGLDPEALLHEAWVERVTLPLLRSEGSNALLSFDELRARMPEVLDPDGPGKPDRTRSASSRAGHRHAHPAHRPARADLSDSGVCVAMRR